MSPSKDSDSKQLKNIIEAAIFASDQPLSIEQLQQLFTLDEPIQPQRSEIEVALATIADDTKDKGYELKQVSSGYRFQVREHVTQWVARLWEDKPKKYSTAFLETLAIIAYRQPVTRGDIEAIRGVHLSGNIVKTLLEHEWVHVIGYRDVPGRPALYATTKQFLDYFNLCQLSDLPELKQLRGLNTLTNQPNLDATSPTEPESQHKLI